MIGRRNAGLLLLAVIVSAALAPLVQAGVIPNIPEGFATELTQVLNNAQLIAQYIRQGEQLRNEILQLRESVRNGRPLTRTAFGNVMADLDQLAGIVQGGRALAYSMGNLDGEFRSRFPGYGSTAGTYYRDYRVWSQTALDTTLSTLRAAGLQGRQLQSEQAVLGALRNMTSTAAGRMQAIQAGNQIAEMTVEQLMKLRQLMIIDLESKQAFQGAQVQKEMQNHAASEQFFNFTPRPGDGRTFGAGSK